MAILFILGGKKAKIGHFWSKFGHTKIQFRLRINTEFKSIMPVLQNDVSITTESLSVWLQSHFKIGLNGLTQVT